MDGWMDGWMEGCIVRHLFQILYDLKPGGPLTAVDLLTMRADRCLEPIVVDHLLRFLPAALSLELAPREPRPREAFLGRLLVGVNHLDGVLRPFTRHPDVQLQGLVLLGL